MLIYPPAAKQSALHALHAAGGKKKVGGHVFGDMYCTSANPYTTFFSPSSSTAGCCCGVCCVPCAKEGGARKRGCGSRGGG
jgi:hypothetical protein